MESWFEQAQKAIVAAQKLCAAIIAHLARQTNEKGQISVERLDQHQSPAYDLAYMMAELRAAEQLVAYADRIGGELERELAMHFLADMIADMSVRVGCRLEQFGLTSEIMRATLGNEAIRRFAEEKLRPECYATITRLIREKGHGGMYGLDEEHGMIFEAFRKYAEDKVMPVAEEVHRHDRLIPEQIIQELRALGCFGLSIPQRHGGFQDDARPDNMGMVIVTEELSRGSLGVAGSLITRPEILSKALLKGGSEEQKRKWLPLIASGEKMVSVAVTEPDFGSDVAGIAVSATKRDGHWSLNGTKTWCTFAGRAEILMVLARTDPDVRKKHRGLSVFIVEKPPFAGHTFEYMQPDTGGKISGRAIGTIGYRGMHSYEVVFENYLVPDENLIGGKDGLGKGFYLQMEGFSGGRLQTAARANGVMQAAFDQALKYAGERKVFGVPIIDYQLTQYKLARMAAFIQASRQLTYHVARLFDEGKGHMESSLVKFFASKISEWVTREAMQIHGGMGYAEEYPVSRYFLDARVFSIFEGAEEVLALRVIARSLLEEYLKGSNK